MCDVYSSYVTFVLGPTELGWVAKLSSGEVGSFPGCLGGEGNLESVGKGWN